jgi:hypothetical protein
MPLLVEVSKHFSWTFMCMKCGTGKMGKSEHRGSVWLYRPVHTQQIKNAANPRGNDLELSFTSPKHGTFSVPFLVCSFLINF